MLTFFFQFIFFIVTGPFSSILCRIHCADMFHLCCAFSSARSQLTSFQQAKGKGVCLIDFGRAIDTTVFPEGTMFTGSNETDGFQCTQMLEGKPWKWQVTQHQLCCSRQT